MSDYTRATLELLYSISRELTADLDLRTVLGRVLALSSKYVHAERASIVVLDHGHPVDAAIIVANSLTPHPLEQVDSILDQGLAGWVIRHQKAAFLPDTSQDQRWLQRPDDQASQTGPKSAICAPVIARDQLVGVLTVVHSTPNSFSEEHLALLQAIADQAGTAINNARLYDSLQAAHQRYQELFEDSIDPIWISDLDGRVLEANRQALRFTGEEEASNTGQPMQSLLKLEEHWFSQRLPELQAGRTAHVETTLSGRNGAEIPVEAYVRKVTMDSGDVLQWILRDISERKALDALRDDLMAMVYHDLRSPLANIISSLEILQMLLPPDADDNTHKVVTIALRSSGRMQRLIATLLDIYRLEAGQPITNRKEVAVAPLLAEAVEAIQPNAESKGQQMRVEVEDDLPTLWIDEDMIRRVIINLLDNATKYILFEGLIVLSARHAGPMVEIAVSDTGPGIPPDKLDQIFDKFTRLQVDRFPKGLGLGLAFCKLAVRSHGGELRVESQLNVGSRFIVSLPVESPPPNNEM